jgi:hypothetical protein
MPKGIAGRGIGGRAAAGGRQVAARYRPPLSKVVAAYRKGPGSGVIVSPPFVTVAEAWLIGGGGASGDGFRGAGGGAAVYKRWMAPAVSAYPYTVGGGGIGTLSGGDTQIAGGAAILVAGGGQGVVNTGPTGIGGIASGGDINRNGGSGGQSGGPGGGAAGASGGGAAGFGDVGPDDLVGGRGGGIAPGGGGNAGGSGGEGKLVMIFTRVGLP